MHAGFAAIIAGAALLAKGSTAGDDLTQLWRTTAEESSCSLQCEHSLVLLQTGTLRSAASTLHLGQSSDTGIPAPKSVQPPQDLSHSEQLMIKIREGCQSYSRSGCGSAVRFELFRIAVASLSIILDFILVAGLICQVNAIEPFAEDLKTSWPRAIHITVGIMEAVLLVAIFFFPGEQRPALLRGLLALEIAFASTVSAVTTDLRSSKDKESRIVGAGYLLLASVKLVFAALLLASPASIDLLWAYFFAHHICPWARAFMGIFQRAGVFKERQSAVATVVAVLVVLPCGPSFCRAGALLALCILFILFSFGAGKTKHPLAHWFGDREVESITGVERALDVDERVTSDREAQLEAEIAIQEENAEAATENFHDEVTVASIYHSGQVALEEELRAEKRNCMRAEGALAQLSAEHMRLISVREELEGERDAAERARAALEEPVQQLDVFEREILRLQSRLVDAQVAQETLEGQLEVSQGNCMTAADEVKFLKVALERSTAEEARVVDLKDQALEELALARQRRAGEVLSQDANDGLKIALLASEATATRALEEYRDAKSQALQHSTESQYLRGMLTTVEAEVMNCQLSITELQEEGAVASAERQELKLSQHRNLRQSEELRASERNNLRQAEELRVTERAAASVYTEWKTAEADLAASRGLVDGLEAQKEMLRAEMNSGFRQASDEQEQIQRLRQQVRTLEEELDSRETRLMRMEPLVVFKETGGTAPHIASTSSSPTILADPPTGSTLSPAPSPSGPHVTQTATRSPLHPAPSPSGLHVRTPSGQFASVQSMQAESPQPRSQSPLKRQVDLRQMDLRQVDEASLQPPLRSQQLTPASSQRSASPMDVRRAPQRSVLQDHLEPARPQPVAQRGVQWLPPGRAQTILASSSLSMPGSASSISSLPPAPQQRESSSSTVSSTVSRPGSTMAMPKSLPAVLPKGASPVTSTSLPVQLPRSRQY
jgi:hypothetical protein